MMDKELDKGELSEHAEALLTFQMIEESIYIHNPWKNYEETEGCLCRPTTGDRENSYCCDDVSCLNYAMCVECSPDICLGGQYCLNQRLQLRQFPQLEAFKTKNKGYGVRATKFIAEDTMLAEYIGEVINASDMENRLDKLDRPDTFIDATKKGNLTRFINHSCEPNCRTEKWSVNGKTRIAILALKDIPAWEELTFDYQWKQLGRRKIRCYCGSKSCKGLLGVEEMVVTEEVDDNGMFREPLPTEIGNDLLMKKIRVYDSAMGRFCIGVIKQYNNGKYGIEFENPTNVTTTDTSLVWEDLSVRLWHIYVAYNNLSDDQVKLLKFQIPKCLRSDTVLVNTSSDGEDRELPSRNLDEHKLLSPFPSSKYVDRPIPRSFEPCNEILITNLPWNLSKEKLSSILKNLNVPTPETIELRYSSSTSALLEFSTKSLATAALKALEWKKLGGRNMRGNYSTSQSKKEFLSMEVPEKPIEETKNVPTSFLGSCYDWTIPSSALIETPSFSRGVSQVVEKAHRKYINKMINKVANKLQLDRSDASQSILRVHRFLAVNSATCYDDMSLLAAVSLFMTIKAQAKSISLKELMKEVVHYHMYKDEEVTKKKRSSSIVEAETRKRKVWEEKILEDEPKFLERIFYHISTEDPYLVLQQYMDEEVVLSAQWKNMTKREARRILSETHSDNFWLSDQVKWWSLGALIFATLGILSQKCNSENDVCRCENKYESPKTWLNFPLNMSVNKVVHVMDTLLSNYIVKHSTLNPLPKKECIRAIWNQWSTNSSFQERSSPISMNPLPLAHEALKHPSIKLTLRNFEDFSLIEKKMFTAILKDGPSSLCGKRYLLQSCGQRSTIMPRNYRGIPAVLLRQIDCLQHATSSVHPNVHRSLGLVFPESSVEIPVSMVKLCNSTYYQIFEHPLHNFAGLTKVIRASNGLDPELIRSAMRDLLSGVEHCHKNMVVHRNITPANVYVFSNGVVKLGGFEMARLCKNSSNHFSSKEIEEHRRSTKNSSYQFTPKEVEEHRRSTSAVLYAAPEILLGATSYSFGADIWSVGCIFSELLVRRPLFRGNDCKDQTKHIFRVCGTPKKELWPDALKLPDYPSMKPDIECRPRLRKSILEKNENVDKDALDLLEKLLELDPNLRISASEALKMQYFTRQEKGESLAQYPEKQMLSERVSSKSSRNNGQKKEHHGDHKKRHASWQTNDLRFKKIDSKSPYMNRENSK